jgi:copper chaperone CopZ
MKPARAEDMNPSVAGDALTTLRVAGMDCPDEVAAIERVLKPLAGVGEVKVNLMAGTATIAHEKSVTPDQLVQAIGTAGLKASPMADAHGAEDEHAESSSRLRSYSSGRIFSRLTEKLPPLSSPFLPAAGSCFRKRFAPCAISRSI